jgi:tetratricopeptide (TPR) repeat protein
MSNNQPKTTINIVPKMGKSWRSRAITIILSLLSFSISINPSFAGDPFRSNNERNIGEKTEAAFKALFEEGNYQQAKIYLEKAESVEKNDPMLMAMRASLAYTEQDWQTMKNYASKTIQTANNLKSSDPLRSNLYLGVGNFLEGAYIFQKDGPIPALSKLQLVFNYLDEAEKIDAKDPELNLIKGYLNLLLAVKFPFSSPEEAITKLQDYASPKFLVNRGIAIAYRDLKNYDQALEFVNLAIESTPLNPELYYLKGQILRQKGELNQDLNLLNEALKNFEIALAKIEQLPVEAVQKPLQRERRKTLEKIESLKVGVTSNTSSPN